MPKIKSNSGAAKRFKKTGSGKFKRSQFRSEVDFGCFFSGEKYA